MTNRKRILNTSLYDFLHAINQQIMDGNDNDICLMMYIDPHCLNGCTIGGKTCGECIQTWLNKEEDRALLLRPDEE